MLHRHDPGCGIIPEIPCIPWPDYAELTFTAHVIRDSTRPTLSTLPNLTVVATSTAGTVVSFDMPTATDANGINDAIRSCNPPLGSSFAVGTTTVTCVTADTFGNVASTTFTVTVTPLPVTDTTTTTGTTGTTGTTSTTGTPSTRNDTLLGSALADVIRALAGNDIVRGLLGNDTIYGDAGDDQLFGNEGADKLFGGPGIDRLLGGLGGDCLNGGTGIDTILGGPGIDQVFTRDLHRDIIDCGTGRDVATVDRRDVVRNCERVNRP